MNDFILSIYVRYQGYSFLFSIGLILCFVGGAFSYESYEKIGAHKEGSLFSGVAGGISTFIGLGLIFQRKWGYYFLRLILIINKASSFFIPFLAPLSTDMDKYLQKEHVKNYFGV